MRMFNYKSTGHTLPPATKGHHWVAVHNQQKYEPEYFLDNMVKIKNAQVRARE